MKYFIFILLLFLSTNVVVAQGIKMHVHLNDGRDSLFSIDSIQKIDMAKHTVSWIYNIMDIFTKQIFPPDIPFLADSVSITFPKDTLMVSGAYAYNQKFYLLGEPSVDSIIFSQYETDTNIILLSSDSIKFWDCNHSFYNSELYSCASWIDDKIYFHGMGDFGYLKIDSEFTVIDRSIYCPDRIGNGVWSNTDDSGKKFLAVKGRFSGISPVSSPGYLIEYTPSVGATELLKTIDSNITYAEYYNNDTIIYYSLGPAFSGGDTTGSGFYFYNTKSKVISLILSYVPDITPLFTNIFFDISPDRKKLLIPENKKDSRPFMLEYDLTMGTRDTIKSSQFPISGNGWTIWVRYSHDGKKILYDFMPKFALASGVGSYGCITGIIDLETLIGKEINLSPQNQSTWISTFPQWSPDDRHFVFITSKISLEPAGDYSIFGGLYLLKKF